MSPPTTATATATLHRHNKVVIVAAIPYITGVHNRGTYTLSAAHVYAFFGRSCELCVLCVSCRRRVFFSPIFLIFISQLSGGIYVLSIVWHQ